jgi:predicted transposase/invertase (TIGR01784 family)
MIPGIDPKIDIAFKKVFGSELWRDLTADLINAVLEPPPEHRVVEVEFLNPYSEKMTLDDKLSILDVKTRDQVGWLYHLEMQMLVLAALSPRMLYYWSKNYGQQLAEGDDYTRLRRTISICFVNGVVFPDWPAYHTRFRLLDPSGKLCLTEDLEIHVIELPKFQRTLAELRIALDFWLYFLKNGAELDADALPAELDRPEIRRAMEVLKMLAQNELERELYEGRLKAKRDLQTLETQRRTLETQRRTLEDQRRTLEDQRRTLEDQRRTLEVELGQWQQRYEAADRERDQALREVKRQLAEQISLCQRLLRRPLVTDDELQERSVEELRDLAEQLEREVTQGLGPA